MRTNNTHPRIGIASALFLLTAATMAADLIALWDFNDSYFTTNNNEPYSLTPGGGVSFVPSPWGKAAEFHGVSNVPITEPSTYSNPTLARLDTAANPTNASFNGGLSIMGWVKAPDSFIILDHDSSSISANELGFTLGIANSTIGFYLRDRFDRRISATADGTPIRAGQWSHFAVTWGGTNSNSFAFYINGQSVSYTVTSTGGFQGLDGSNPLRIRIGSGLGNSLQHTGGYDGMIDHLSLYAGSLTAAQVHSDYAPSAAIEMHAGIQITGTIGATYRVEYTLDLTTPNWSPLMDVVLPSSPYTVFDPVPINQTPKRFYRVSRVE